jgi:hypothetical protein
MQVAQEWMRGCRAHSPGPCRETLKVYSGPQPYRIPGRYYEYHTREYHGMRTRYKRSIEGSVRKSISDGDRRTPTFRGARDEVIYLGGRVR